MLVDGVVAINEVVDLSNKSKRVCLILKVDFKKACDLVSWNFLDYMLSDLALAIGGDPGREHVSLLVTLRSW